MQVRRSATALMVVAVLSLALGACGGSSGKEKSLADKPNKLTIGIKFDQPGLGLKAPDGSYRRAEAGRQGLSDEHYGIGLKKSDAKGRRRSTWPSRKCSRTARGRPR